MVSRAERRTPAQPNVPPLLRARLWGTASGADGQEAAPAIKALVEHMMRPQTERDQAQAAARDARDTAETLRQADAERRGRGLVARLRAALRGE